MDVMKVEKIYPRMQKHFHELLKIRILERSPHPSDLNPIKDQWKHLFDEMYLAGALEVAIVIESFKSIA